MQQAATDHVIEPLARKDLLHVGGHEPRIRVRLARCLDVRRGEIAARVARGDTALAQVAVEIAQPTARVEQRGAVEVSDGQDAREPGALGRRVLPVDAARVVPVAVQARAEIGAHERGGLIVLT